jgi:hypothetical protein
MQNIFIFYFEKNNVFLKIKENMSFSQLLESSLNEFNIIADYNKPLCKLSCLWELYMQNGSGLDNWALKYLT